MRKSWIQIIHIAKNQLNLDDEAYRAILESNAGVSSSKDIVWPQQFESVMTVFKQLGFVSRGQNPRSVEKGTRCTSRQLYYIRGLWDLASKQKSEKSLRAIIRRIAHVDDPRFMTKRQASDVILALRDITEKAGFSPDGKGAP